MSRALMILLALAVGMLGYAGMTSYDLSETPASDYLIPAPTIENISPAKNSAIASTLSSSDFDGTVPLPSQLTIAREILVDWIEQANDVDARKRAAAIDALAVAPKAAAVPALRQVLNGGAAADRQLALDSLRTLALNQGDTDGQIRDVLRLVIYDGDDDAVAMNAQAMLEEIERGIN